MKILEVSLKQIIGRAPTGDKINNIMPYNVIKNSKGKYKVRYKKGGKMHTIPGASESKEKAEKRIAAIEISKHNESVINEFNVIAKDDSNSETNEVGHALTFVKTEKDNKGYFTKVEYSVGDTGSVLDLYYKLGKDAEATDYIFFQIDGKTCEDPHSEETAEVLKPYNLTGDDIEMAGEDGYKKIADEFFGYGPEDMFDSGEEDKGVNRGEFEESFSFEATFNSLMK